MHVAELVRWNGWSESSLSNGKVGVVWNIKLNSKRSKD
jgi:hypothetical protein